MTSASGTSPVVEKVTRTRTLPASEAEKQSTQPDFWEYIESLKPEQWSDHIVYLYREDPKVSSYAGEFAYLDKFIGYIEVRPGVQVPMEERGVIEQAIKEKFGGRAFRLICKRGRERVTVGKCVNEAPPKYPDANPSYANNPLPNAQQQSDTTAIANKAIDTVANHPNDVMNIAINALRASAEMISRTATPANAAASSLDDELKRAMIQKFLHPEPVADPFTLFLKFKEIMSPPATNSVKETFELIGLLKSSGLVGDLGGRRDSGLIGLGREVLPIVANTIRESMHEWRIGTEAQVRAMELQRGNNPPPLNVVPMNTAPQIQQPQPANNPAPPTTAAAPTDQQMPAPPLEWIETKIVEILKRNEPIDDTVDLVLDFLYVAHPQMVGMLLNPPSIHPALKAGEEGLLQLFQNRVILQQIPVNPRLTEFIKKFIAAAKESEAGQLMQPEAPPPANAS